MLYRAMFLAASEAGYRAKQANCPIGDVFSRWLAARRTRLALSALDKRILKDIGLARPQIEEIAVNAGCASSEFQRRVIHD